LGLAGFLLFAAVEELNSNSPVYKRIPIVLNCSHELRHVFEFSIDGITEIGNNNYAKKALIGISPHCTIFPRTTAFFNEGIF
jgi:hypothetical protein